MKFTPSAFGNDYLTISRWELIKLFFGMKLQAGPVIVKSTRCVNIQKYLRLKRWYGFAVIAATRKMSIGMGGDAANTRNRKR